MSHLPSFTFSEFLTPDVMFLYGSLYQSNITYNTNEDLLSLEGTDILYDPSVIQGRIDSITNIINVYKESDEYETYADTVGMLVDIKDVLTDTLDRLTWLP